MTSSYQQSNSPETRLEDVRLGVVEYAAYSIKLELREAFPELIQQQAGRQVVHNQLHRQIVAEDIGQILEQQVPAQTVATTYPVPAVHIYDNQSSVTAAREAVDKSNRGDNGLSA